MRKDYIAFCLGICASLPAMASNEGVPSYYQQNVTSMNRAGYANYQNRGYTNYTGAKQVVGSNSYTYRVPSARQAPSYSGVMTANGVSKPASEENGFSVYGGYGRRFADFQFTTSVNSVLEWDDMVFNELTVGGRYNFSVRDFDLTAFGEYTYGKMTSGGLSMDYDLKPYDENILNEGIFTISVGEQSGESHRMRLGIGAPHIWDIGGWKLTPILGYEVFKHNLQMSDHYYPNQGVYIPLITDDAKYVFGYDTDDGVVYDAVPQDATQIEAYANAGWYQVCMSPDQIQLANVTNGVLTTSLPDYDPETDYDVMTPWGVTVGSCVVIGGDGPIVVSGKTHEYDTTWSGFFLGLEIEKQVTLTDKLRFYGQISMPKYSSEGIWPNRTDWQQNPSFLDEGDKGALAYSLEMEYDMKLSDRLQLSLKADTNYFHVDNIGGEIYWAPWTEYQYIANTNDAGIPDGSYTIKVFEHGPETERVADALKEATWQSFGLYLGLKYSF